MLGPHLAGKQVELFPPTMDSAIAYYRWMASPEVTRYLAPPPRISEGIEKAWLDDATNSKTQILWAIHGPTGHIGFTRVYAIDWVHGRAYGSTWLGEPTLWRQGYATEALRLRNNFVFTQTSIVKMQAEVLVENTGTSKWLLGLGYRHVGIAEHHVQRDGHWHDMWLGEVVKSAWMNPGDAPKAEGR